MAEAPPKSRLSYCKDILQQRLSDAITALTPRRRFSCLPIRVPVSPEIIEVHPVYSALQDILNRTFLNLYALDQALLHSDYEYGHFQRSPSNPGLLSLTYGVPEPQTFATTLHLEHVADAQIADQIRVLYNLRHSLAVFLSQFYMEIDKFGKTMPPSSSDKSFASLLITLNFYFSKMQASISAIGVGDLSFDKLYDYRDHWPDVKTWDEQWSDYNIENALSVMDTNLNKLEEYISMVVSKYRKPRNITHWMRYIFGAIGISIFSVWLIRSGIVDNLVLKAKKIFSEEQALIAERDEFLETMRTRQKEEIEQLKSTSSELRSMLSDFSERIKGEKSPSNVSDHEMLEIATTSFEEQLRYPIRNFIWGELPRLLHIHILQITHDLEASMCKVHHEMLMDYEATSAIRSYMPILYISFGVLMISRAWAKQTKAKGRIARGKRRLLLDELEERIEEFENLSLSEERGHHINGLLLFTLDRLFRVVERHAKAAGEWQWVRDDLTVLGDPYVKTSDKLHVISGLNERYHCLQPLTHHELLIKQYTTWERDSARKELTNPRSGVDSESITFDDFLWD
ncbi:protein DGS1, mitochondrial [Tanacetum coccineum]